MIRRAFRLLTGSAHRIQEEVEEELRFHLEHRTAQLTEAPPLGEGLPEAEARERALAEMGDLDSVRRDLTELTRERRRRERRTMRLEGWMQDFRYALRTLRRSPGYAVTVVLTLTIGIGATTAVFSAMNPFMFRPLPFPEADRLIQLGHVNQSAGFTWARFSLPQIADYRERAGVAEAIGGYYYTGYNLTDGGPAQSVTGGVLTPGMLSDVLQVDPLIGRGFAPEEFQPGSPSVVILDHRIWQARFGGDPGILGRTIDLDGLPHEVLGVMPKDFVFPFGGVRLWVPDQRATEDRDSQGTLMVARLRSGVDRGEGIAEFQQVHAALATEHPTIDGEWDGLHGAGLREALNFVWDLLKISFSATLAAVMGVLLIACVNVTGLTLARTGQRVQELGVRSALGAARSRIVRQLVAESLLLALIGGMLGILLATFLTSGLDQILPEDIYRVGSPRPDLRVLLFTLGLTVTTPLVFGLWPALAVTKRDLTGILREGTAGSGESRGGRRLRSGLVVTEVAVGMVLLTLTGLMLQSAMQVGSADLGLDAARMLTAEATTEGVQYPDGADATLFWDQAVERVAQLPGVTGAGTVYPLPLNNETFAAPHAPVGVTTDPDDWPLVQRLWSSPGYFEAAGLELIQGRDFRPEDRDGEAIPVVVSTQVARAIWPDGGALGRSFQLRNGNAVDEVQVVGLIEDHYHDQIDGTPEAVVYQPMSRLNARRRFLILRTEGDPVELTRPVRAELTAIDPSLPVEFRPMDLLVAQKTVQWSAGSGVLAVLGALALLLSAVGVYGIVAHSVERKRREMAIRLSLGAATTVVRRQVLVGALRLVSVGIILGALVALASGGVVRALLYQGSGINPIALAASALAFLFVAVVAAVVPAGRAARIAPAILLRSE